MVLNVHSILRGSRANGPGRRTVIWVQGCSLRCPDCFNPDTHSTAPRDMARVADLVDILRSDEAGVEGVTLSGGEPLDQAPAVAELLRRLRCETHLSVVLFSGYTWEEIQAEPDRREAIAAVDVLLAGRYDASQRLASGLRGSANQTVHFLTDRYGPTDLAVIPPGEVLIGRDGEITLSGVDPVALPPSARESRPAR